MLDSASHAPAIRGNYIGGKWVATSRTFEDLNPSDNSVYARAPDGTREDMTRAIEAAQAAFADWSARIVVAVIAVGAALSEVDLGGIGKGYALDQLVAVLEDWDIQRVCLIGGGSSIRALEPPSGRTRRVSPSVG